MTSAGDAAPGADKVLDRTIHHAPVYRLLAQYNLRLGEVHRAMRAHAVMEQLGFAEDADRAEAARVRGQLPYLPSQRPLDDDLRSRLLVNSAARDVFGEIMASAHDELTPSQHVAAPPTRQLPGAPEPHPVQQQGQRVALRAMTRAAACMKRCSVASRSRVAFAGAAVLRVGIANLQ